MSESELVLQDIDLILAWLQQIRRTNQPPHSIQSQMRHLRQLIETSEPKQTAKTPLLHGPESRQLK